MSETDFLQRKHPRLKGYDYSQNGCYFVTLCTKGKKRTLSSIVGRGFPDSPYIELSEFGKYVDEAIIFLHDRQDKMSVEKYVIMPNHVHLLIIIEDEVNGGASRMSRPTEKRIPRFISSMKRYTNKISKYELWQDGYYDHIIRDENDFLMHWKYIDDNPAKWTEDKYYIG